MSETGLLRYLDGLTAFGAQRQHVTLPTGFRLPFENSHSRYGYLTARFAPSRPSALAASIALIGKRGLSAAPPRQRTAAHDIDADRDKRDGNPVARRWPFAQDGNGHQGRHRGR